jgi:hypothetical protein
MTGRELYARALARQIRLRRQRSSRSTRGNIVSVKFKPPEARIDSDLVAPPEIVTEEQFDAWRGALVRPPRKRRRKKREEWEHVEPDFGYLPFPDTCSQD